MRERYEDYMTRRIREEEEARNRKHEAEYEERKWKEFEEYTNTMHNLAEKRKHNNKIYESPDGGKTVYERAMGAPSNTRRLVQSPEEQKINEHRNLPSGWREITTKDGVDFTPPEPDETYPVREDVPAELWGKNIKEVMAKAKPDMVNHPPHYNKGIETTTYINSWDMSFSQGNVVKYVTRYNLKHDTKEKQLEDLKKARWYLEDVIKKVENS